MNEWQACAALAEQGDFDLFLLAGRYTLLEQEALDSFLPLCVQRGIGIIVGGPYNSGILATGPKPGAFYNYEPAPPEIVARVDRLQRVCRSHGVALAEAALAFPLAIPPSSASYREARRQTRYAATPPISGCEFPRRCGAT